jgi:hypothetical protein
MYRSTSYASEKSKTMFVEMAERSARAARLQETRAAQLPERTPSLTRRAASTADRLLEGLRKRVAQRPVGARG